MVSRCITQLVAACHLFCYHDTAMAVESVANRPLETSDCHQGQRAPDVHITQEQVQELQTECTGLTRVQVARLVKVITEIIEDLYNGTIGLDLAASIKI